jgi:hypothetical protein
MAFWTDGLAPEPKRQFRFRVLVPNLPNAGTWYARSATKPTFSVTQSQHKFLNHTFYYPGKIEWNTVSISFADPTNPDATGAILQVLRNSGYNVPANINDPGALTTLGKANSVSAIGVVNIEALDDQGNVIEQWTLNNAFIVGISFNDYAYDGEEISTVDMELRYDWAAFNNQNGPAGASDGGNKNLFSLSDPTPVGAGG